MNQNAVIVFNKILSFCLNIFLEIRLKYLQKINRSSSEFWLKQFAEGKVKDQVFIQVS